MARFLNLPRRYPHDVDGVADDIGGAFFSTWTLRHNPSLKICWLHTASCLNLGDQSQCLRLPDLPTGLASIGPNEYGPAIEVMVVGQDRPGGFR